jgi:penicillin-binding protein 1C
MPRARRVGLRLGLAAFVGAVVCVGVVFAAAWWVPLPERIRMPGSSVIRWRDGGVAHAVLAPDDRWRIPVSVDEVDPAYVRALLSYEDARFWSHPGVDPLAVARATVQNLSSGRVVSGASTLTMQLVRLSEPRPRTLRSKAVEAARAVQLELRMSKADILAGYLSLAPFGGNLEGVEAASWAFFGHGADALSPDEIALLLAIPQDPSGRAPGRGRAENLRAARDHVAQRLAAAGALPLGAGEGSRTPDEVLAAVAAAPVPERPRPLPRSIHHAVRWMQRSAYGPVAGRRVDTTLDRGVQALAERVVHAASPDLKRSGIQHVAVVVADWQTGELRALVGGADFWSPDDGAQIPAFAVPRSPGSTLKPFLYAAAIEEGRTLPGFLVPDVPTRFGVYAPTNYDGEYDGLVRLESALSRSLNVPFVRMLRDVGVRPFLRRLQTLGVRSLDADPSRYGLSLVVGGVELTPLDLAAAYAALAADGRARPLRWRADAEPTPTQSAMSPGAAWLTRRALALRDRPDFPSRMEVSAVPTGIHWKTGTSFGHRDAWAIGSGKRHTVVVWLGNLDNSSSRRLVGAEAAGPLLFDVLEGLDDGLDQAAVAPADLAPIRVCALSGRPPGADCPQTREALARTQAVPTERCAYHHKVEVDDATGLRVTPGCRAGRSVRSHTVVKWPPSVRRWLGDQHLHQPEPPPLAEGCSEKVAGAPPRIVSPEAGAVAVLIPGMAPSEQEIPLEAEAGSATLHWFVDGARVGVGSADERVWWEPAPGEHEVLVMDDAGRTARIHFQVREG